MFNIGDKVICINAHPPLIVGQEYTIKGCKYDVVWLEETHGCWAITRFVEKEPMAIVMPKVEDKPAKPTIVLNAKAKPKEQPKPIKEKGKYLPVEQFVDSNLYKNFLRYEDNVVEAYNAIKHVYLRLDFDHQRTHLLKANDLNQALVWADWEIDGWSWHDSFNRCHKNKQKAVAEAKKAKQQEKAI